MVNTILSLIIAVSGFCSWASASECSDLFSSNTNSSIESIPATYHVMPRLFKNGLNGIAQELDRFFKMGVRAIWLGPIHPQTIPHLNEWKNDHGYWVSDHSAVAEELGGESALIHLIQKAHKTGIKIYLDAPLNHFGYGETVQFNQKQIKISEHPELFLQTRSLEPNDFATIEQGQGSDNDILLQQEHIASLRLAGLNDLNLQNPVVQDYLIQSYKKFVDLGVDGFRIDAVKHIPRLFTARFINELQAHSNSQNRNLDFILELLLHNARSMHVVSTDILKNVEKKNRVYFIDFPLQGEIRKMLFNGSAEFLKSFLEYRISISENFQNLIPMPDDHDIALPLENSFHDLLAVALNQFLSFNPSITHHGSEQSTQYKTNRPFISTVKSNGNKAKVKRLVNIKLKKMGVARAPLHILMSTADTMVVQRTNAGRSLLFIFNKSNQNQNIDLSQISLEPIHLEPYSFTIVEL